MKQTLEEAAKGFAKSVIDSFGRGGVPSGISDIKEFIALGFENGSEWRINSVWHDASEVPEERRFCIYILSDGTYGCGYYHIEDNTIWYARFADVVKWAYFQDITPNMEN